MGARLRLMAAGMLGMVVLGTVGATVALGATAATCRVRNLTQGTAGRSFAAMVAAAVDGDRLTVRGTCHARSVTIGVDLAIVGVGDGRAILDARSRRQAPGRVLRVESDSVVTLRHLVITGGDWVRRGGGIINFGDLTMNDSVVRDNSAWPGDGAGILNLGTMTVQGSAVRGNHGWSGGGVANNGTMTLTDSAVRDNLGRFGGGIVNGGTLDVRRSSVTRNRALDDGELGGSGGGILNTGRLFLAASSVSDNTADRTGGGITNQSDLVLVGSSVTGNTADFEGGGILNSDDPEYPEDFGTVTLLDGSSVTGNTPDDCHGTPAC